MLREDSNSCSFSVGKYAHAASVPIHLSFTHSKRALSQVCHFGHCDIVVVQEQYTEPVTVVNLALYFLTSLVSFFLLKR
jgi:hypothetical protein